MNAQVAKIDTENEIAPNAVTPLDMVNQAVTNGASMDVVERLMGLHERWETNQARKAFDAAIAAAKGEIPVIGKNRTVDFTNKAGQRTNYDFEDLSGIAKVVDPILSTHGLSYRFRTTSTINEPVSVTCILSHRDGHSEENTLSAARDESGNKNSIQAVGSTITYLQRYSLKASLGLSVSNDDDGAKADNSAITDEQVSELAIMIVECEADEAKFLKWAGVENLASLPSAKFGAAQAILKQKVKSANGGEE